jgi:hypothetical protein
VFSPGAAFDGMKNISNISLFLQTTQRKSKGAINEYTVAIQLVAQVKVWVLIYGE